MLTWTKAIYITETGKTVYAGVCLAADDKPTGGDIGNGSKLTEIDTATDFLYDEAGESWISQ